MHKVRCDKAGVVDLSAELEATCGEDHAKAVTIGQRQQPGIYEAHGERGKPWWELGMTWQQEDCIAAPGVVGKTAQEKFLMNYGHGN
jgi:hypothetical protein